MTGTLDLACPYCKGQLNVNHDDGRGREENVKHEMHCHHCGKNFVFETEIIFSYSPQKADCLNDGIHDFQPTKTIPREFTEMECTMCEERKKLTDEERKNLDIGTEDSYFEKI